MAIDGVTVSVTVSAISVVEFEAVGGSSVSLE